MMRASNMEEASSPGGTGDPWDVFTQLVIQIIEGRTPGGEKGFHAGPHCSLPHGGGLNNRHVCDPNSVLCVRFESLLRQLRLMWGVGVGVSVEVLVAPECEHGAAFTTSSDATTAAAPSPQLRLIEQWNFTIFDRNIPDAMTSGWSLVAAVRSYLHFSQLSAWLSASGGTQPPNVLYRLTVTSPVFCSKFETESEEHTFPVANVGQETAIKVMVRSLPRSGQAPTVACRQAHSKEERVSSTPDAFVSLPSSLRPLSPSPLHPSPPSTPTPPPPPPPPPSPPPPSSLTLSSASSSPSSDPSVTTTMTYPPHSPPSLSPSLQEQHHQQQQLQGNSKFEGSSKVEEDLRRSMMRARLGDASRNGRSESPDTQLGESLLDPPNSLARIPRRFQSPSRSGSPSMETPEHIICRVRQPGPSHGRPPDMGNGRGIGTFCQPLVVPARQPLNAFAWTQTRYPGVQQQQSHHHHQQQQQQNQQQQQQQQHQYRHHPHHLFHSGVFHPESVSSDTLAVDHHHHHQFSSSGSPYSYPRNSSSSSQGSYSSNSEQVFWSPTENYITPSNKSTSSFTYQMLNNQIPFHCPFEDAGHSGHLSQFDHQESDQTSNYLDQFRQQRNYRPADDRQSEERSSRDRLEEFGCHTPESEKSEQLSDEYGSTETPRKDYSAFSSVSQNLQNPPCAPSSDTTANNSNVIQVVSCVKEQERSQFNLTKSRESQGMKRKGAYNKESPRTKRESPPHIYYSKEGKGSEDLKEEGNNEEENGKRKSDEDDLGIRRKNVSNKRGIVNDRLWTECSNDQLWPSCSQPGKHLCSSVEDLSEILAKDDVADLLPNVKSLRKDKQTFCKLERSCSSKVSFDLTPKETQEVLRVLRQSNPVPPLRMTQHKQSAHKTLVLSKKDPESSTSEGCFHLIGKSKLKKVEEVEGASTLSYQSKNEKKAPAVAISPRPVSSDDGGQGVDEGTANATSSNKSCDTSFKKPMNCSCDKKLNDVIDIIRSKEEANDSDDDVLDGLTLSEIENLKKESLKLPSNCVEAKTITQKTNYFTASSQPASGTKDIHKQTSQALIKSPLTSVLSSLRNSSIQDDDYGGRSEKDRAKRFLQFEDCGDKNGSAKDTLVHDPIVASECHIKEEAPRKKQTKDLSMFKQLIRKAYLSEERERGASLEEHSNLERPKANEGTRDLLEKSSVNGQKRTILNLEEECSSLNEEDKEVEDLCRAKGVPIPSSSEKVKFRRSLDSAATLVFHNKTGLPLTSSPAPLRKGTCFDFDSSLNSVAAIRNAFRTSDDVEEECCESLSKDSSLGTTRPPQPVVSVSAPATVTCSNLLGSFEECVLNGRLEPVSTVQGFSAEIAASGTFCPKHTTKPVTVFFYTLCDNDQISSPYMGHINLGKKGYHVPNKGTVQVTLFNPHGTVVKMFVVVYDLSDMPCNSKTFLRQRTLNMPVGASDSDPDAHQWLRYLIHLRFASSKSGKIYLHTDIRMLIFRKSDADAATLHKTNVPYELRSFTHGPTNPKFSPRK